MTRQNFRDSDIAHMTGKANNGRVGTKRRSRLDVILRHDGRTRGEVLNALQSHEPGRSRRQCRGSFQWSVRNGFIKPLADSFPPDETDDLSKADQRAISRQLADIRRAVRAIQAQLGLATEDE
jgi:hypothetical protein